MTKIYFTHDFSLKIYKLEVKRTRTYVYARCFVLDEEAKTVSTFIQDYYRDTWHEHVETGAIGLDLYKVLIDRLFSWELKHD